MGILQDLWDPGDWGKSVRDVAEDVVPSIKDIIDDIEPSINDVGKNLSKVFDAIADKPFQFALQLATQTFFPQFLPFVSAGIAASNGAKPEEILKTVLFQAVSQKIAPITENITNNTLTEIGFNSQLSSTVSNIAANTIQRAGTGDLETAFLTSVGSAIVAPIKAGVADVAQLLTGIESEIEAAGLPIVQAINAGLDAVAFSKGDFAQGKDTLLLDTISKILPLEQILGQGQYTTALEKGITVATKKAIEGGSEKDVEYALFKTLEDESMKNFNAIAVPKVTETIEKLPEILEELVNNFGFEVKRDGTVVNKDGIVTDKKGKPILDEDRNTVTYNGGTYRKDDGNTVYYFKDGSSIEVDKSVSYEDLSKYGIYPTNYDSAEQFKAFFDNKLFNLKANGAYDAKFNSLHDENRAVYDSIDFNATVDPNQIVWSDESNVVQGSLSDIYDPKTEQDDDTFDVMGGFNQSAEDKAASVADITAMADLDDRGYWTKPDIAVTGGGQYKILDEVGVDLAREIVQHNKDNPDFLVMPEGDMQDLDFLQAGNKITDQTLDAIKKHNETLDQINAIGGDDVNDLKIDETDPYLAVGNKLDVTDASKLTLGKKLSVDNVYALDQLYGKDIDGNVNDKNIKELGKNTEQLLEYGQSVLSDEFIEQQQAIAKIDDPALIQGLDLGLIAYNDIMQMIGEAGRDGVSKGYIDDFLIKFGAGGMELANMIVKGYPEMKAQGITGIFTDEDKTPAEIDFLNKQVFNPKGEGFFDFVTYSKDAEEELLSNLSEEGKEALRANQPTGDLVFKRFGIGDYSISLPVVENFSLGEAFDEGDYGKFFHGYSLKAAGGMVDIIMDVAMFSAGGFLPKLIGVGANVLEAAGGAAMEIEQRVAQALQDNTYLNGDEYQRILAENDGNALRAAGQIMVEAKSLLLGAAFSGAAGDIGVANLITKPVSKYASKVINSIAGATGASLSEFFSGMSEKIFNNMGVNKALKDDMLANFGEDAIANGIDELAEAGSGVVASAVTPLLSSKPGTGGGVSGDISDMTAGAKADLVINPDNIDSNNLPPEVKKVFDKIDGVSESDTGVGAVSDMNEPVDLVLNELVVTPEEQTGANSIIDTVIEKGGLTDEEKALVESTFGLDQNKITEIETEAKKNEQVQVKRINKILTDNNNTVPTSEMTALENNFGLTFDSAQSIINALTGVTVAQTAAEIAQTANDDLSNVDKTSTTTDTVLNTAGSETESTSEAESETDSVVDSTVDSVVDTSSEADTSSETESEEEEEKEEEGILNLGVKGIETEKAPKVNIDYFYDIGGDNIFATDTQAALFPTPTSDLDITQQILNITKPENKDGS